ncbi:MAG: site-specific integrase, partial [Acidobacteria bacterium]|nr:site-specific integrase [Acidobacteriota bacterium]
VLTPIWVAKPETARRVRQRTRTVLRWCQAHEYVEHNMAGESIDGALPPQPKVKNHFRALHYLEVPEALETVDATKAAAASKLALRFAVLTAARPGEALGCRWSEIDMDAAERRIPGDRMKAGAEHRVPLSTAALDVLDLAKGIYDGSDLVFPSPLKPGCELSNMTLTKVLRDCGLAERATVHGFRASFRTWALEQTDAPWAVAEAALSHTLGDSTTMAYIRGDAYDQRRELMQRWADFLES